MNEIVIEFIETLTLEDYQGVGIIGSYAIGTENKWSDIDLFFLTEKRKPSEIVIFENKYFTLSYYTEDDLADYKKKPSLMLKGVEVFKRLKILYDPYQKLQGMKDDFSGFKMTCVDKEHSLFAAKKEFIGFIEEAQKSLSGLMDHHNGKMLCGLYGLTYGMFQVLILRDALMTLSDNDFYDVVMNHLEDKDPIKELAPHAFGIVSSTLEDQVEAGLEIFIHVGNSLMKLFDDHEREFVLKLMHEIIKEV